MDVDDVGEVGDPPIPTRAYARAGKLRERWKWGLWMEIADHRFHRLYRPHGHRRNDTMTKIKSKACSPGIKPTEVRPSSRNGESVPLSVNEIALNVLTPSILAANTIAAVLPTETPLDIPALTSALGEQSRNVIDGDLSRAEAMLMAQAHTLNAMFTALTRRAVVQEYLNQYETHMRLALKAQSQCRATLETLAVIKNPAPVTFVRQANVAHGPQQVNNRVYPAAEPSRAGETQNPPNKLLEQQHGERLDDGTAQAAVGADTAMAALAEVHGAENAKGQEAS
jgi:hypothetical protein